VVKRVRAGIPKGDGIEVPEGGAEGMIVTQGGRFGGYGFYVLKNKPLVLWNLVDLKRIRWEGPELAPGKHMLEFDFTYDGLGAGTIAYGSPSGLGRSGTGVLKVDGKTVSTIKMDKTIPTTLQWDENFDVGADTGTPVNDRDYQVPFRFTGDLDRLTLTINRPKLSPEDIKKL
jgi:arylsulfatase